MAQSVTIRIPDDLLAWLDRTAGELGQTRTERIVTAVKLLKHMDPAPGERS
jgi:predicted transcriptional regulator